MNYDAIVIGTGFGGTIAATKLAAAKKRVLMLERGTWWVSPDKLGIPTAKPPVTDWAKQQKPPQPVQYWPRPDHKDGLLDLFASIRYPGNKHGLYDYHMFEQAHVLTSSAVGGGSMIYSNVTLKPEQKVLDDLKAAFGFDVQPQHFDAAYQWMADFRGKLHNIVTKIPLPGLDLKKNPLSDFENYLYLDRSRKLRDAAATVEQKLGVKLPWAPLDLAVIDYEPAPDSDSSKAHAFCERQGRCILGCLPQARQTLTKTLYSRLLSDPNSGVALQPLTEVHYIKRVNGGYQVAVTDHRDGSEQTLTASAVFLAAGTLGSTEILLRSRDNGLPLSPKLGKQFSGNGDFGAFAVGTNSPVYSARGPINTSHLTVNFEGKQITIEDAAIPAMFAAFANIALNAMGNWAQLEMFKGKMVLSWLTKTVPDLRDFFPHLPDTYDPTDERTENEMVSNIFFYNVMGQDRGNGEFSLHDGELDLHWQQPPGDDPVFGKIERLLQALSSAMGAQYVPFPLWKGIASKKLIIVHPLGGCPIGHDGNDGVVDLYGRVFDCTRPGSKDLLPGLYVVDGSTIPGPLAVNPTLTISAQAIRALNAALNPKAIGAGG